ncbi:MAG TPA: hypothetical protein DDE71_08560 [Tenacibaculum sp.]|nr:hypothetical protein [Tenacibaculum sp.]
MPAKKTESVTEKKVTTKATTAKKVVPNKDNEISLFEELFKDSPEIKYPRIGEVISATIVKIEKKNILVDVNNQFS